MCVGKELFWKIKKIDSFQKIFSTLEMQDRYQKSLEKLTPL